MEHLLATSTENQQPPKLIFQTYHEVYKHFQKHRHAILQAHQETLTKLILRHDEIDSNMGKLVSKAAVEDGDLIAFCLAMMVELWEAKGKDQDGLTQADLDTLRNAFAKVSLDWENEKLAMSIRDGLTVELVLGNCNVDDDENQGQGGDEINDGGGLNLESEKLELVPDANGVEVEAKSDSAEDPFNASEARPEVGLSTQTILGIESENQSNIEAGDDQDFRNITEAVPEPRTTPSFIVGWLSHAHAKALHIWNSALVVSQREWFLRQWNKFSIMGLRQHLKQLWVGSMTQVFLFYFLQFAKWIVRVVLGFIILAFAVYVCFYSLWHVLLKVLGQLPFIGLPIQWTLLRLFDFSRFLGSRLTTQSATSNFVTSWVSLFGWFGNSIPDTKDITVFAEPVTFENIDDTVSSAVRLSQLGVSMLPIATILKYSSRSLKNAAVVVETSNVFDKRGMSTTITALIAHVNKLEGHLSTFDSQTRGMIDDLALRLTTIRSDTISLLDAINTAYWPSYIIYTTSFFTLIGCFFVEASSFPLKRPACSIASAALYRSECTIRADSILPLCSFIRERSGCPASDSIDAQFANLKTRFYSVYIMLRLDRNKIFEIAEEGKQQSGEVDKKFEKLKGYIRNSEEKVYNEINSLNESANEPPGWWAYLNGQKTAGLQISDRRKLFSLQRQTVHLGQVKYANHDAYVLFTTAMGILDEMGAVMDSMDRETTLAEQMSQGHIKGDLIHMKRSIDNLGVLIEELRRQGQYAGGERNKLLEEARIKFIRCIELQHEVDVEKGLGTAKWEDCFFGSNTMVGEGKKRIE